MLVLSRKKGESIKIGDSITIYIIEIRGDKTRIGIEAPAEVQVLRSEIADKYQQRPNDGQKGANDGEV